MTEDVWANIAMLQYIPSVHVITGHTGPHLALVTPGAGMDAEPEEEGFFSSSSSSLSFSSCEVQQII